MLLQPPSSLTAVTDASAANSLALDLAPAQATALTYMNAARACGLAPFNAVQGQHQQREINAAACVCGVLATRGRGRASRR